MTDAAERLRDMLTNMDPADAPAPGLLVRLFDEALADAYVAGVDMAALLARVDELTAALRGLVGAAIIPDALIGADPESKVGSGGATLREHWDTRLVPALAAARAVLGEP